MTASAEITTLANVIFAVHRAGTALAELPNIVPVYESAYREDPYNEGPDDVAEFREGWPARVAQPSFRLVTACLDNRTVGFAFGHQLRATTQWWRGMLDGDVERDVVTEHEGRTFAVIELAVDAALRNHGIGRELHAHLLAGLREERATLLVRPEATAARYAYLSWAYQPVGQLQPFDDGPTYDAMVKRLRLGASTKKSDGDEWSGTRSEPGADTVQPHNVRARTRGLARMIEPRGSDVS